MKLSYLLIIVFCFLGCDRTPHKYRNDVKLDDSVFAETKDSLVNSLERIHNASNELSYFSRSRDRELRLDFLDFYFDSSGRKVIFTFVDSVLIDFENVNLSKQSLDGNIYYPFIYKGELNEKNIWEIEKIDGFNLVVAFSTDFAKKSLKRFSLREMDTYTYHSGRVPYKYNIDDIRIFEGPLFQDSDSVRSGE